MPESFPNVPLNLNETSLIWGGSSIGDAADLAPYDYIWVNAYLTMMARLSSTPKYGVLYTNHVTFSGNLAPSNPAATTLRVASGAAINYRVLYLNNANVDFDCPSIGYYRVVLRLNRSAQTVRLALLGHNPNGFPPPVRTANIHDITIALVYSDGATLTVSDMRRFARNIVAYNHSGEALEWYIPSTGKRVKGMMMESGSVEPEMTTVLSSGAAFPRRYPTPTTPLLFFQAVGGTDTPVATQLYNKTTNNLGVNYMLDSINNLASIWWMSFGLFK